MAETQQEEKPGWAGRVGAAWRKKRVGLQKRQVSD